MAKNLLKSKIENIAKKLLNKNHSQLINNDFSNNINTNQLSSDESTIKDSVSEFEDISKTLNPKKSRNNKNKNNILLLKNSIQSNSISKRHHSSLCTKMTSLSEFHSGEGTLDYNSNLDLNIRNNSSKSKKIKDKFSTKSNELLIKNIIDNNINNINLDLLNNLINIYKKLIELFNHIKNYEREKNNLNINEENKKINKEIILLSYKYINYIFHNDMELLIKIFYENIEIQKYFLSQIYFFISIIYLYEDNIISNSYLLISYRTIIFYSLHNLENIINIINLPLLLQNEKLLIQIKSLNKIILSILKILNPKIPSNSQILDFISPTNLTQNNINNDTTKKNSGLLKLINLLKENTKLKEKLEKIKNNTEESQINEQKLGINENIITENIKTETKINNDKNMEENDSKKINENNTNTNNALYNKLITPILPPIDKNKYKYSIAIELDETLVHYCEEDDNYYAKVRFGSENFLKEISNFFEIIVVSTSGKEYSNIIIDNINKGDKCYVIHRLYTENYIEGINLSKINRDFKNIIFVCHEYNFLNAPKENIILLKEFNGEEDDREIIKLHNELKLLMNNDKRNEDNFDIRIFVPKIMERIRLNIDNIEYLEEKDEEYDNDENSNTDKAQDRINK